jgi:hypothetical protein
MALAIEKSKMMDMPTSSANPAPKQENPESLWGPDEDKLLKACEEGIARSAVTERKTRQLVDNAKDLVEAAKEIAKELQASMSFIKPKYEELLRMKEQFAAQVLVELPLSPAHPAKTKARPAPPKTNKTTQKQEKKARAAVDKIQPAVPPKSKTGTIKTSRKPLAPASGKEGQCSYTNPQGIRCENEIAPTKSNKVSYACLPHRIKADKGSSLEFKKQAYEGHHQWYKAFEKSEKKLGTCYDKDGNPVKKSSPATSQDAKQGVKSKKRTRDEAEEKAMEGEKAKKKKKASPATSPEAKQGVKSKKRPPEEAEEKAVEENKKKKKKKKADTATSSGKR